MINDDKSKTLTFFSAFILFIALFSCLRADKLSFIEVLPSEGWSKYHKVKFDAYINDTLSAYDILISLRNSYEYPFRNIFLFVTTTSPAGHSFKDTLEYNLANTKGKWIGKGLGDIHNLSVPYKSNILFPNAGKYTIEFQQGMRRDTLYGLLDIGMIIRKLK